jgi:hypothetical protein
MRCAFKDCNKEFSPKTHNQKYCSDECCRTATNIKIKERYYYNKERLAGKKRVCQTRGCKTILSRYNELEVCGKCEAEEQAKERNEILRKMGIDTSKIR